MIISSALALFGFLIFQAPHAFTSRVPNLRVGPSRAPDRARGATATRRRRRPGGGASVSMRDASASYWFRVGDRVRVVDDVPKAGANLRHRIGTVVETWEKCDVDPTCCCAEQVDAGMAVRVEFRGTEADGDVAGAGFFHYFAESELVQANGGSAAEDDRAQ